MRREELKAIVDAMRELGVSYEEAVELVGEVTKDLKSLRPLWGKPGSRGGRKGSGLIKAGISLIAFPIPTVGIKKSLGTMLIAAGLVQQKMKHLHVAEVYTTFQDVNKELQKFRQKTI